MTSRISYAAAAQSPTASVDGELASDRGRDSKEVETYRPLSPQPIPQAEAKEEDVYVLTFLTNRAHHQRMTELRNKYFPKQLNKLAAHLTIFHALPGSRLEESILPTINEIASRTSRFNITATQPFRLGKRGIAIRVQDDLGGSQAKEIRRALQAPWKALNFLTEQDAQVTGRFFPHYTVMNKVDDEAEVKRVEKELERAFVPDEGVVEGLGLYLYDKGRWRWVRRFNFMNPAQIETT